METAVKNAKKDLLLQLLRQLATYVALVGGDDEAVLLSSGFELSKDPSPVGPLSKPEDFGVQPVQKGQLRLMLKAIYGAKLYRFEYRQVAEEIWKQEDSTASKVLLTGLESGKEYLCRVLPCGASKVRTYSDEITCFVV